MLREAGISEQAPYTLFASDQFDFTPVDRQVQIAFANSVFSHLTLNSIFTALLQLQNVLAPAGVLYATVFSLERGRSWLNPHPRNKWGRHFETYPHQDPYHYPLTFEGFGTQGWVSFDVIDDFGHPTQTMCRFRHGQGGSAGSAELRIVLLATLRDEAQAIRRFRCLLEAMEADSRVKRLFCSFYENDSSDDTPEYLPKWFKARQCLLHSERLGAPVCTAARSVVSFEWLQRAAYRRQDLAISTLTAWG